MPFECELPSPERREMMMLSRAYRARHSPGFRRRDEGVLGSNDDPETGIERSAADLLPEGQGIQGPAFVLRSPIVADDLALEHLSRDEHDGSKPLLKLCQALAIDVDVPDPAHPTEPGITVPRQHARYPMHERGRAEEELAHLQRTEPRKNARIRTLQGREALTDEERRAVEELNYAFQATLQDFARKGWIALESPLPHDPRGPSDLPTREDAAFYRKGTDDSGWIFLARWLPAGLDEAERRISGDPYWRQGALSILAAMPGDVRAKAVQRNPWANQKYLAEGGGGD